jgi:hypothetical protein
MYWKVHHRGNIFINKTNRTQKAVVEFIWIGGQFLGITPDKNIHISTQQSVMLSETNFLWWGSNIVWSLKKYEKGEKGLVLWDVIAALQVLKKSAPTFLETLLHSWVLDLFSDDQQCASFDMLYHSRNDMMSKVSSRKLHLLNIICRKVMLSDHAQYSHGGENSSSVPTDLWNNLLVSSERELRERLVAFTFSAVLNRLSYFQKGTCAENMWFPVGVAQMDSWVSMNNGNVHNQLNALSSTIKGLRSRYLFVGKFIHHPSWPISILQGSKVSVCSFSSLNQKTEHCICFLIVLLSQDRLCL